MRELSPAVFALFVFDRINVIARKLCISMRTPGLTAGSLSASSIRFFERVCSVRSRSPRCAGSMRDQRGCRQQAAPRDIGVPSHMLRHLNEVNPWPQYIRCGACFKRGAALSDAPFTCTTQPRKRRSVRSGSGPRTYKANSSSSSRRTASWMPVKKIRLLRLGKWGRSCAGATPA